MQGNGRGAFRPKPDLKVQKAVLDTITAVNQFTKEMDGEDFLLTIKDPV